MPEALPRVAVVGRFPPPLDGQAIATRRLATLLGTDATFDLSPGEGAYVSRTTRLSPRAVGFFLERGRRLRDWAHAHADHTVLWTGISASRLGHARDVLTVAPPLAHARRVYGVVHQGDFGDLGTARLTRRSARRLVSRLSGVVFLSQTLAERAPWVPPEKRVVVPNTIDGAMIASADELARKRSDPPTGRPIRLLFFSNMIPSKGFLDVVRAVGVLRQRGVDARADFVGRWSSEDAREAFESAVAEARVADLVTHHGGVSDREAARAHYLRADVFCLPTAYPTEAQPLTVLEALAAGTPAVVTPHASLPEMIAEGASGAFCQRQDPESLADAVERVAGSWPTLSVGARARFDATYAPAAVRDAWLALLQR